MPTKQNRKTTTKTESTDEKNSLYKSAMAVEKDDNLHQEMKDWEITLEDGLNDEK